jgi:hypothetical protein
MFMRLASTYKRIGSLAVIAVTLWLGGFGCSLCCATGATDSCCLDEHKPSARATASGASATSCSAAACSCCRTSRADRKSDPNGNAIQPEGAIGCLLLPNRVEGVTVQIRVDDAFALQGEPPAPLFALYPPTRTAALREAPPPLNRGGTYLRCCVLLI